MPRRLSSFDARDNGITPARLGLALMVVVSHSVSIGRFGSEPLLELSRGRASLGFIAVIAFFALSGFLIAGSRERTSVVAFMRNRALRILPAYWLALAFAMLVAVPIAGAIRGVSVDGAAAAGWVWPRLLFLDSPEAGVLTAAFGGGRINGSLWTLGIEVFCYAVLAVTPRRWLRPMVIGELALLSMWALAPGLETPGTALLLAFACGAAAWLWRRWIPMSGLTATLGAGGSAIALLLGAFPIAIVLISYTALGLASLPIRINRDLSYGVYVLAYPIGQVLATAGLPVLGLPVMIATTVAVVLPLAYISSRFVEQPALSLRTRLAHIRLSIPASAREARAVANGPVFDPSGQRLVLAEAPRSTIPPV